MISLLVFILRVLFFLTWDFGELSFYFTSGILWSHILESSSEFLRSEIIILFFYFGNSFYKGKLLAAEHNARACAFGQFDFLFLTSGFLGSGFWKLFLLFGIWNLHRHFVISFFDFGVWFCWSKILYFVELRQPIPYFYFVFFWWNFETCLQRDFKITVQLFTTSIHQV